MNQRALKSKMVYYGLTQRDVANKLGVSIQTVNDRVNGRTDFDAGEIVKMCELLHIDSPDEICDIFLF